MDLAEEITVLGSVDSPLFWHRIVGEDRLYRALWLTCATIDTLVRINVILVFPFVNTIDRADRDTRCVLGADTRLGNDVGHLANSPCSSLE